MLIFSAVSTGARGAKEWRSRQGNGNEPESMVAVLGRFVSGGIEFAGNLQQMLVLNFIFLYIANVPPSDNVVQYRGLYD